MFSCAGPLDAPEHVRVEDARLPGATGHERELLLGPGEPAERGEFVLENVSQPDQMPDVLGGVGPLSFVERPARPVVALRPLVELDAEVGEQEARQSDAGLPQELRADHRVEQRLQVKPEITPQIEDVLLRGVQYLDDPLCSENLPQRLEAPQGEGIDEIHRLAVGNLDEAALVMVVVEGVGLGVNRQGGGFRQALRCAIEIPVVVDPDVGRVDHQRGPSGPVRAGTRWRRTHQAAPTRNRTPMRMSYFRKVDSRVCQCSPVLYPKYARA